MDLQVKKIKVDIVTKAKLFPRSLSTPPRQRQITHSPHLRGRTRKTYFKMYCFKSTFLKHVAEECTFC